MDARGPEPPFFEATVKPCTNCGSARHEGARGAFCQHFWIFEFQAGQRNMDVRGLEFGEPPRSRNAPSFKQSRGPRRKNVSLGQRRPHIFLVKRICLTVLGRWNARLACLPPKESNIDQIVTEFRSGCHLLSGSRSSVSFRSGILSNTQTHKHTQTRKHTNTQTHKHTNTQTRKHTNAQTRHKHKHKSVLRGQKSAISTHQNGASAY